MTGKDQQSEDVEPKTVDIEASQGEKFGDIKIEDQVALGEHKMRKDASERIVKMFQIANICMWLVVFLLVIVELFLLTLSESYKFEHRLIDGEVIMVLIGATVVQLGTIMLSMSKFLFPNKVD